MLGVPSAPVVGLAQLVEVLACVGPQRLEHLVAGLASGGVVDRDHRLGHEAPERVEDVPRLDAVAGHDRLQRRHRRSPRRTRRAGRTPPARSVSSSEYDQSTVARSVWWRSIPVRRPPVSRRNRSSMWVAMSLGFIAATRAAASSIASGIPSRRRQISTTAPALVAFEREPGARRRGAFGEQQHRVVLGDGVDGRGRRRASAATAPRPSARPGRRGPPGSTRGSARPGSRAGSTRRAGSPRRAGARSCRTRAAGASRGGTRRCSAPASSPTAASPRASSRRPGPASRRRPRPRARRTTRRRGSAAAPRPRPAARAASCRPRRRR